MENTFERNIYNEIIYPYRYECVCMLGRNNQADMETLLLLKKISAFMQMGLEEYELSLKGILLICFRDYIRSTLPSLGLQM